MQASLSNTAYTGRNRKANKKEKDKGMVLITVDKSGYSLTRMHVRASPFHVLHVKHLMHMHIPSSKIKDPHNIE